MSWVLPFGDQQVRARTKPVMAADKSVPASCTERNLLRKKGMVLVQEKKSDHAEIFSEKNQLYNPQKESIYWKLLKMKQLFNCLRALGFVLWILRMMDVAGLVW